MRGEELVDIAGNLNARGRQQDEVVAGTLEVGHEVRRQHDGGAGLGRAVEQRLHEGATRQGVEVGERLVEEKHVRAFSERERERHLCSLASGKFANTLPGWDAQLIETGSRDRVVPSLIESSPQLERVVDSESPVQRNILCDQTNPADESGVATRDRAQNGDGAGMSGG